MSANDTVKKRSLSDREPASASKRMKSSTRALDNSSHDEPDSAAGYVSHNPEFPGSRNVEGDDRRILWTAHDRFSSDRSGEGQLNNLNRVRDDAPSTMTGSANEGLPNTDESGSRNEDVENLDLSHLEVQPSSTIVKNPGTGTHQTPDSPAELLHCNTWINILVPKDPGRENGPWEKVSLDTQAETSVIFHRKVVELGLENTCYYSPDLGSVTGISRHEIQIIGDLNMRFIFDGAPDEIYEVKLDVLEDDLDDTKRPPFNILIGRPTLSKYGLVTVDRSKIPNLCPVRKTCRP